MSVLVEFRDASDPNVLRYEHRVDAVPRAGELVRFPDGRLVEVMGPPEHIFDPKLRPREHHIVMVLVR